MPNISYAQNFEDVMLWRALRKVSNGFYIDIGAQHPRIDSVSRLFYDHGWRGMHIEAQLRYALMLQEDRPDEVVLPVAISDRRGVMVFYEVPIGGGGLSTGDPAIAEVYRDQSHLEVRDIITPTLTLDDVFLQIGTRDIHWLKIDVEGMEGQVIDGWTMETVRPWILVIESTYPMTETQTHQSWEQKVLNHGYCHAYWDGLNRFYVAIDRPELLEHLRTPPNVFDDFSLSGLSHSPFCSQLQSEHLDAVRHIREADDQAKRLLEETHTSLAAHSQDLEAANRQLELEKIAVERERDLLQRLTDQESSSAAQQLQTAHRQFALEKSATERERALLQRLADQETSSAAQQLETVNRHLALEKIAAERERALLQRLADQETSSAAQQVETANRHLELARIAIERERELLQRLVGQEESSATRQLEAANQQLELEMAATDRERELLQRLAAQEALHAARRVEAANRQLELERLATERERELIQRLADHERETMSQQEVTRQKERITWKKFRRRKHAMVTQLRDAEIDMIQLRDDAARLQAELIELRTSAASLQEELRRLRADEADLQAELVRSRTAEADLRRELDAIRGRRPWRMIARALGAEATWSRPNALSTPLADRKK